MLKSIAAAAMFAALAGAGDKEAKVKMRDLPEPVRRTVQEQARGATLRGLTKESEGGKTYYEAELRVSGHGKDVLMDESGAVVEVEEEVPMASLPAAARESLQKSIAGGKLVKLESISKNGAITAYEAEIKKNGKTSEVKVTPGGRPVEK